MNNINYKIECIFKKINLSFALKTLLIIGVVVLTTSFFTYLGHLVVEDLNSGKDANNYFSRITFKFGFCGMLLFCLLSSFYIIEINNANISDRFKCIFQNILLFLFSLSFMSLFLSFTYLSGWLLYYVYANELKLWNILLNVGMAMILFPLIIFISVAIITRAKKFLSKIDIFDLDKNRI